MMARKKRSVVTTVAPQADTKGKTRYQDQFQQNFGKKLEDVGKSLGAHKRNLLYGLIALVVLASAIGVYFLVSSRTNAAAQAALAKAIETSEAPVTNTPPPAGSTSKQFKSAKERSQAAIPEFQAVAEQFGGPVREKAKYFIAVHQLVLDRPVGIQQLEGLAGSDDEVGKLSKFSLAQTRIEDGRLDEAATLLQELAAMSDPVISKDSINLELARVYEKQGKKQEAVDILFNIAKSASEAKDLEGKPVVLGPSAQAAKDKLKELDPEKAKEIPEPTPEPMDLNQINVP
jgi:predicted negative regulator of RcsB-dependent stress response